MTAVNKWKVKAEILLDLGLLIGKSWSNCSNQVCSVDFNLDSCRNDPKLYYASLKIKI